MRAKILGVILICLFLTTLVSAQTVTGKIKKGKQLLWAFQPSFANQIIATAMWEKKSTDLDMYIFVIDESSSLQDDEDLFLVGAGVSETKNLERVTIGVPSDALNENAYLMLDSISGPSTKFQLNLQFTSSEELSKASLKFVGEFDPYEAGTSAMDNIVKKALEKIRRIKLR